MPPPAGVQSPSLWGSEPHLKALFGDRAAAIAVTPRQFTFRYRSPAHFVEVFRTWYGPVHKAFGALPPEKAAALEHDMIELFEGANRGGGALLRGAQRVPGGGGDAPLATLPRPRRRGQGLESAVRLCPFHACLALPRRHGARHAAQRRDAEPAQPAPRAARAGAHRPRAARAHPPAAYLLPQVVTPADYMRRAHGRLRGAARQARPGAAAEGRGRRAAEPLDRPRADGQRAGPPRRGGQRPGTRAAADARAHAPRSKRIGVSRDGGGFVDARCISHALPLPEGRPGTCRCCSACRSMPSRSGPSTAAATRRRCCAALGRAAAVPAGRRAADRTSTRWSRAAATTSRAALELAAAAPAVRVRHAAAAAGD